MPAGKLVVINSERLVQFVERVGGEVSLVSVASRFGMDVHTARMMVSAHATARLVICRGDMILSVSPLVSSGSADEGPRRRRLDLDH